VSIRAALLSGLVLVPNAAAAAAQANLELLVSREPYYIGVPADIHVRTTEFEADPEPSCSAEPPEAGQLVFRGMVPNISSSVRIVNGRISRSKSATFTCQYQFIAASPGSYRVGPFHMAQGQDQRHTGTRVIQIQKVPLDDRLRVRVLVPEDPVYVGQHMPVRIEWWLSDELQDHVHRYSIQSRLFQMDDAVRFVGDEVPNRGDQTLTIETSDGELALKATVTKQREGGRDYLVVAAERTLVPLRTGVLDLATATVHVEEITRFQRDLFGRRTAARTRKIFSQDIPRKLVVKAPPSRGRPESFAGAVGRGFSLEVTADRSVVQLGDPITLTLTVRGDGNLASIGLPRLDAHGDAGLSPRQFRLPEGDVPGQLIDDAQAGRSKVFRIPVRVLDDSVREIPALAYSWFDPEQSEYQTTQSRPIALSVHPAQVISADDVVGTTPDAKPATADQPEAPGTAPDATPRKLGALSMTGADLSIERDPEVLLHRSGRGLLPQAAAYTGSLALVLGALWARRRAEADPQKKRLRRIYQAQRKRIEAAKTRPRRQALAEIAAALREITAAAPELRSHELEAFVRECDSVIYAPGTDAEADLEPEIASRADTLLAAMHASMKEALK
jgi:hypothetical protein